MSIISDEVHSRAQDQGIEVFFISRAVTKWWNARRKRGANDIALLGGWYWSLGGEEHGPFRSQSAAWRDAYYRRVMRRTPPLVDQKEARIAETEIAEAASRERRRFARKRPEANLGRLQAVA